MIQWTHRQASCEIRFTGVRTPLGERCVLAHRGWAGENGDFFNSLLELGEQLGGLCDGDDPTHDGVNAAEVGVLAWSESGKCKGAVREH
jgi:hypothetical protein